MAKSRRKKLLEEIKKLNNSFSTWSVRTNSFAENAEMRFVMPALRKNEFFDEWILEMEMLYNKKNRYRMENKDIYNKLSFNNATIGELLSQIYLQELPHYQTILERLRYEEGKEELWDKVMNNMKKSISDVEKIQMEKYKNTDQDIKVEITYRDNKPMNDNDSFDDSLIDDTNELQEGRVLYDDNEINPDDDE